MVAAAAAVAVALVEYHNLDLRSAVAYSIHSLRPGQDIAVSAVASVLIEPLGRIAEAAEELAEIALGVWVD